MVVRGRTDTGMPELADAEVDRLFRALADATRRDIVRRTIVAEQSVSVLAADYAMSFAAVQKHVAVLEEAGLVTKHPRGRERLVRAVPDRIARARLVLVQLEELWRSRFSQLDDVLAEPSTTSGHQEEPCPSRPSPPTPTPSRSPSSANIPSP